MSLLLVLEEFKRGCFGSQPDAKQCSRDDKGRTSRLLRLNIFIQLSMFSSLNIEIIHSKQRFSFSNLGWPQPLYKLLGTKTNINHKLSRIEILTTLSSVATFPRFQDASHTRNSIFITFQKIIIRRADPKNTNQEPPQIIP